MFYRVTTDKNLLVEGHKYALVDGGRVFRVGKTLYKATDLEPPSPVVEPLDSLIILPIINGDKELTTLQNSFTGNVVVYVDIENNDLWINENAFISQKLKLTSNEVAYLQAVSQSRYTALSSF